MNPLTIRLHGLVEPYSDTASVSRMHALDALDDTASGICLYLRSTAKRARRCVAFIEFSARLWRRPL